jgi:hypothetical protein
MNNKNRLECFLHIFYNVGDEKCHSLVLYVEEDLNSRKGLGKQQRFGQQESKLKFHTCFFKGDFLEKREREKRDRGKNRDI